MTKTAEFADHVLDLTAYELDIPKGEILSKSRKAEVVDARHLAAKLLHAQGIYPSRIASIFGFSPRSIQYVITSFDASIQTNRKLRSIYAMLAKQLGNNREETAK